MAKLDGSGFYARPSLVSVNKGHMSHFQRKVDQNQVLCRANAIIRKQHLINYKILSNVFTQQLFLICLTSTKMDK